MSIPKPMRPVRVREVKECKQATNPCRICLEKVTTKTGLLCQGTCHSWAHYECLNFTPGKIDDIKNGRIIITCPCLKCKSAGPREYVVNEPFTCNNAYCPANHPACCQNYDCVANEESRKHPICCPAPGTLKACDEGVCFEFSEPSCSPYAPVAEPPVTLPLCPIPDLTKNAIGIATDEDESIDDSESDDESSVEDNKKGTKKGKKKGKKTGKKKRDDKVEQVMAMQGVMSGSNDPRFFFKNPSFISKDSISMSLKNSSSSRTSMVTPEMIDTLYTAIEKLTAQIQNLSMCYNVNLNLMKRKESCCGTGDDVVRSSTKSKRL